MQARHFFGAQHAARAVQLFKSREWSQLEFLQLLESIGEHGEVSALPDVALRALYGHLPAIANPLVRHSCLEILGETPKEYKPLLGLSLLESNDIENAYMQALHLPRELANSSSVSRLRSSIVAYGALNFPAEPASETASLAASESASLWTQLFEASLAADHIQRCHKLWRARPAHADVPAPALRQYIQLIGRHEDKDMLEEVSRTMDGELPLTSAGITACFSCFAHDVAALVAILDRYEHLIDSEVVVQDGRLISDALAPHVVDICRSRPHGVMATGLGNLLLQGVYRQNSSQTVFHFYRLLVDELQFRPNEATAQILANAAYRLGNSKLVSFGIWKEFTERWQLSLGRKFYETALMCQMVGSNYTSVLFFLAEMARQNIVVRQHIRRALHNKFDRLGDTSAVLELVSPGIKNKYRDFECEAAANESSPRPQAEANAQLFVEGKDPANEPLTTLTKMLDYDRHRQGRTASHGTSHTHGQRTQAQRTQSSAHKPTEGPSY